MKRRDFLARAAAAGAAAAIGQSSSAQPVPAAQGAKPKARLKLGHQHWDSDSDLRFLAAMGVTHICSGLPSREMDEQWSVEGLAKLRQRVEGHGLKLDMVPLPLSSSGLGRVEFPNIMLGKSPERDREIDAVCQMIANCANAEIPAVKYNLNLLGVVSTAPTYGRGGARQRTFVYDQADGAGLTAAGEVGEEETWERITYFLKRVVPVAASSRVRLCCHPHDPGMMRGRPFKGIHRVLGTVAGLKRFIDTVASPYHGLNFCQGSVAEMLEKPNEELPDIIRYFGTRGKIFNVHFRNIQGGYLNFRESFPDDGDVDMPRMLRIYREVGYDGMLMPDHAPRIAEDENQRQAFAFAFGYMRALIQLVNEGS